MKSPLPVVVIGAGPYGLATAAYLRRAGVPVRIFGEVMGAWHRMPKGMYLRSMPPATSIGYRWDEFSLERYDQAIGGSFGWPIPLDAFIAYGHWFQEAAIPDVEPRAVKALQRAGTTFSIQLDDQEHVKASSVVVAAGIAAFA